MAPGCWQIAKGYPRAGVSFFGVGLILGWTSFLILFRTFAGLIGWLVLGLAYAYLVAHNAHSAPPRATGRAAWLAAIGLGFLYPTALAAAVLILSPFQLYRVPTDSMTPTIAPGALVVVDTWAYRWREPKRGEVAIMLGGPTFTRFAIAKRIVGLPGDRIRTSGARAAINGVLLDEPYVGGPVHPADARRALNGPTKRVPKRAFYVLGDNRRESVDSRTYGHVSIDTLRGRVCYLIYSSDITRFGTNL